PSFPTAAPQPVAAQPARPQIQPVAQPAPAARAAAPTIVAGEHRVVVHTVEGLVKRGTVRNANLDGEVLELEVIAGQPLERITANRLKAVFFLLPPGAKPPAAEGTKIRVTFRDDRQVAGFSTTFEQPGNGFFMIPADSRTATQRIYVYRAAVKGLARG
ncbi:MAG: DUF6982 domain-containing protein, partial [Myxococcales bacterium]